jgi:F-type H+-transporting ATPase subunit b
LSFTRHTFLLAAVLAAALASAAPLNAAQGEPSRPHEAAAAQEAASEAHEGGGGWLPVIAKLVNFSILAGVLVYFTRAPLTGYLDSRITVVRDDLVTAAETRETAARQLAEIEARMRALPMEIDALKRRGADDIAAERARIEQAAETERRRLLEHARREIEMRLRVARRELVELTADLAVRVAAERIRRTMSADDQTRLIDRYAAQIQHGVRP